MILNFHQDQIAHKIKTQNKTFNEQLITAETKVFNQRNEITSLSNKLKKVKAEKKVVIEEKVAMKKKMLESRESKIILLE